MCALVSNTKCAARFLLRQGMNINVGIFLCKTPRAAHTHANTCTIHKHTRVHGLHKQQATVNLKTLDEHLKLLSAWTSTCITCIFIFVQGEVLPRVHKSVCTCVSVHVSGMCRAAADKGCPDSSIFRSVVVNIRVFLVSLTYGRRRGDPVTPSSFLHIVRWRSRWSLRVSSGSLKRLTWLLLQGIVR